MLKTMPASTKTTKSPAKKAPARTKLTSVNVAIVGLGFGVEFIPIYQKHPQAKVVALCQRTKAGLDAIGKTFGVEKRYQDYAELLKDPEIDLVHINTPVPDHGKHTIAALKAGKHVVCTVPMAGSEAECKEIFDLVKKTGLTYMMAETAVFTREYLYMKDCLDHGILGRLQFLQATHQQDMDGHPEFWEGFPPMWYATHCIAPMSAMLRLDVEYVSCFGSGSIRKDFAKKYGSSFAVESAHLKFKSTDVAGRVVRSLYDTARQYRESMDVYGSKCSIEWPLVGNDPLIMHRAGLPEDKVPKKVQAPDYAKLLPKEIRPFTTKGVYDMVRNAHTSFLQGGGHGGSHPHIVHEIVDALTSGRDAFPSARHAANWTCAGLCAHASAKAGGQIVKLPTWTLN